ncbi:thiaminase II [Arsenicicoccus sp. oral taxon 190]|uniref:thiaminase II n=1 Tax=Arsenicicoccus sp. oral taxon 190 TaxID=1658671 RepID=UPI000679EC91|nr:thiaminase II [Arsenicicoccus sp. oral taxon 190]AKT50376.1 TenA family transcriptional regulator [Arsenicicoccus sp. oral taxon 190]
MTFTADAWTHTADVRSAIDELPFVQGLADGTLERERFAYYMAQDALYLADYGRVLAALASQATDPDEMLFWAESARTTVVVERELHGTHVADLAAARRSPTCLAYTSYLASLTTQGSYAVAAAGVLPCFWIYQDVGDHLLRQAGALDGHAYGDWIGMYSDAEFAASVSRAKAIVDRCAAGADGDVVARMHEAYATAARYEWMFWDAAWRQETWPV